MKIFYVRPGREGGYGIGDGSSYQDAWNGIKAVDWNAVSSAQSATLWACGNAQGPSGFITMHIEWTYLAGENDHGIEPSEARTHSRRESPVAV